MQDKLQELKIKPDLTRQDIADLLKSIGAPGEKRDEKLEAVKQLGKINRQGHGLELTLDGYGEY